MAILVAVPLVAMLLATAAVAAPKKPYDTDISPDSVLAGTCVKYTVYIQNQTKTQQLGSANYTLDSDFVVNASTTTGDCKLSLTLGPITNGGTGSIGLDPTNNYVIQLRDLALAPPSVTSAGGKVTFTFYLSTGCPPAASPYVNSVVAKQSNNYSGDPGNDMTAGTTFDTDVAVSGTCSDVSTSDLPITGSLGSYSVVSNGTDPGRLIIATDFGDITCDGYTGHTDTVTAQLLNSNDTKTVTLTFKNVNNEPKSSFKICVDPDEDGPIAPYLAPDCPSSDPTDAANLDKWPCVLSIDQTKKTVTMKLLAAPGDVRAKG